jgi:asparagine synthetase B (glutamine-hydrolysing)
VIKAGLGDELIDHSISSYLAPYWRQTGSRLRAVQCWMIKAFLPWLLKDNDRCSMASGLEGRFPFLSNELVTFALRLPPGWNYALEGVSREKLLLRRAASGLLPKEIWRDRVKSPLPSPEAAPFQARLAERLALEVEKASDEVWGTLDEDLVRGMTAAFRRQVQSASARSSRTPLAIAHLGRPLAFGVPHLFAILTFLRWHELYFNGNRLRAETEQEAAAGHG